ncbi:MAG: hypothetical protein RL693_875 [Verrucomicrobiota bacterium]|jgi:cupin 2 domain-containing protein
MTQNIFTDLDEGSDNENFLTLFESAGAKIERIASHARASPKDFWYDQDHDEWVIVLKGEASLEFEGGDIVELKTGDYRLIQKHVKHRVERTTADTIWLAVHVQG